MIQFNSIENGLWTASFKRNVPKVFTLTAFQWITLVIWIAFQPKKQSSWQILKIFHWIAQEVHVKSIVYRRIFGFKTTFQCECERAPTIYEHDAIHQHSDYTLYILMLWMFILIILCHFLLLLFFIRVMPSNGRIVPFCLLMLSALLFVYSFVVHVGVCRRKQACSLTSIIIGIEKICYVTQTLGYRLQ